MKKKQTRIIKKYPNRRLYDTEESRYITLAEVRELVATDTPFKIVDTQTSEDITRNILLQVIIEQESDRKPLFSTESLLSFIRNYDVNSQQTFSSFIEQSLQFFEQQQNLLQSQMKDLTDASSPLRFWADISEKNMDIWKEMQDSLFNNTGKNSGLPRKTSKK